MLKIKLNRLIKRYKTTTIDSNSIKTSSKIINKEHYNNDYQFLQQSKLSTFYFQSSLPRLPIPLLNKTCERYLNSLKPLLIDESYRKTENVVNKFQQTDGRLLQKLLKLKDNNNKFTSYITQPWYDMYLKDRKSLPINYNPLLLMKMDKRNEYNDQLIRSTNLIISSLRFMKSLRNEYLKPEIYYLNIKNNDTNLFNNIIKFVPKSFATYIAYGFKAFPLDMSQYNNLFGCTRIPELDKDRIYCNNNTKHIIVIRNGNFYQMNVLDNEGYIESPNIILGRLKQILNDKSKIEKYPIGVLTTLNRNDWATIRHHLIEIGNVKQMKLIDSALFCVCLDNFNSFNENDPRDTVRNYLCGDGTNRWFDKSISLIIGKDGTTAVNFEHSWGDGVAVLRYFNEIYNETINKPIIHPNTIPYYDDDNNNNIKKIEFIYDDRLKNDINNAKVKHLNILNSLNINYLRNNDINKNLCKLNNISPDSIMQLSFQLAYKMQFNKYVGTYESCSTAAFLHGRTETMRPCTNETKLFCDLINNIKRANLKNHLNELIITIENCSKIHNKLTKDAAMGHGFDRHLFGLKIIAAENDIKLPNLYNDVGYELLNYNIISTSTLSSPGILAGGFGPVVNDGLGIAYSIKNDECGAIVTSYEGQRDGKQFIEYLMESFEIIKEILKK